MKKSFPTLLSAFLAALLPISSVQAAKPILYTAPQLGAPVTRIGAGTRGEDAESVKIQVLAPEHTALTSRAAPTLYWYISGASPRKIEVTLSLENGSESEPILEKTLGTASTSGIQAIRLSSLGVELKPGVEYRWSVALIADSQQRSNDQIASATIRREAPAAALSDAAEMAAAGYWYDALELLIENKSERLSELLKQAGLSIPGIR